MGRFESFILLLWAMLYCNFAYKVQHRARLLQRAQLSSLDNLNKPLSLRQDYENLVKLTVKKWVDKWVIVHGLCPWAGSVNRANLLKVVVQMQPSKSALGLLLKEEVLQLLDSHYPTETTLVVVPQLKRFEDFLDYVECAEDLIRRKGWSNRIQLATFHPAYQFQGSKPDDVSNFTNRSPYPILHLLKVKQVTEAIARVNGNTDFVWENNIRRLKGLGIDRVREIQADIIRESVTEARSDREPDKDEFSGGCKNCPSIVKKMT